MWTQKSSQASQSPLLVAEVTTLRLIGKNLVILSPKRSRQLTRVPALPSRQSSFLLTGNMEATCRAEAAILNKGV